MRKAAARHYKKLVKQLNAVDAEFELHKINPRDSEDFEYEMIIDIDDHLTQYFLNIDFDNETQEAILNLKRSDCKKISRARVPYHNFLEIISLEDIIEKLLMEIDGACKELK